MSTIKDVARLAGVAPSTVSHYITGHAPVKDETRLRIEAAIQQLGYRPNVAARSLRLKHTQTIGLLVPNIANPFFAEIVQAVNHACQQMGYSLLLADSGNNEEQETTLIENMLTQYIDGLLVIHSGRLQHRTLLDAPPRPIVFVDREVENRSCVVTDNYTGGRLAARHLIETGHRNIGMLVGDAHVKNVQQRVAGFQYELALRGLCVPSNMIIYGSQSLETGRDVHFLMLAHEPPTAIFATNDIIALGAWHKLSEMRVGIPEDVSLVGFDNIDMSQWTVPALTTVSQDKHELGRQSVVALIRAIQSKTSVAHTILVAPSLIVRNSTGSVAQAAS